MSWTSSFYASIGAGELEDDSSSTPLFVFFSTHHLYIDKALGAFSHTEAPRKDAAVQSRNCLSVHGNFQNTWWGGGLETGRRQQGKVRNLTPEHALRIHNRRQLKVPKNASCAIIGLPLLLYTTLRQELRLQIYSEKRPLQYGCQPFRRAGLPFLTLLFLEQVLILVFYEALSNNISDLRFGSTVAKAQDLDGGCNMNWPLMLVISRLRAYSGVNLGGVHAINRGINIDEVGIRTEVWIEVLRAVRSPV
ncbi:hypothetical protein BDZ91DRAFT_782473 [Kalaharituber pfeilii]|nr:hypothetical protein BDZ91DRAFT_782473 [Kalaharituber pfeilii]